MSLLGQVSNVTVRTGDTTRCMVVSSPSEDVQDMLVNGKNYKTMHSTVSFFAKTYI